MINLSSGSAPFLDIVYLFPKVVILFTGNVQVTFLLSDIFTAPVISASLLPFICLLNVFAPVIV